MVVRAVHEPALVEARSDDAAGLVREEVDGTEEPGGSQPPGARSQLVDERGDDGVVVDELGEAEEEVSRAELLVELRVRVRGRAADQLAVADDAQKLDVAVAEVRRLAAIEVA